MDIYSINTDGTGLTRITYEKAYGMSNLSINPRGDVLMVLGTGDRDDLYPLWMIPINDPTQKRIIRPNLTKYRRKRLLFGPEKINYDQLRNPRFSPDGAHILFTWPFHEGIYLMDLKTSLTKRIWNWDSESGQFGRMYPRFSRDGKRVIFSTVKHLETGGLFGRYEPEIWVINTDGTSLRSVDVK